MDLTKNEKPFKLLTTAEQKAMKTWPHGWEQLFHDGWDRQRHPEWAWCSVYRTIPGPKVTERTVTRKEIVPGWYGGIYTTEQNADGVRISFPSSRLDVNELTAAIATLTEIRDAMATSTLGQLDVG